MIIMKTSDENNIWRTDVTKIEGEMKIVKPSKENGNIF